jgi:nitrogenase subunit NifH
MKTLYTLISFAFFSSVYAAVDYNLCADRTKTDCEALHMPTLGQIDSEASHQTFTCGAGCRGDAYSKSLAAVALLSPQASDLDLSHYITFEANPIHVAYFPLSDNVYERVVAVEKNDYLTLKTCQFSSNNLSATLENYKKKHNAEAGSVIINEENYNNLKTAFQAQIDDALCEDLQLE